VQKVSWLWEPWIPDRSLTLVSGDPQLGKSTLLSWLASSVTGQMIQEGKKADPMPAVLWIAGEESWTMATLPRMEANGADVSRVLHQERGNDASRRVTVGLLTHELPQLVEAGIRLVVIDPIASLAEEGSDWQAESSARQCLDALQALAGQLRIPIIGTRNWNKRKQGSRLDRICGSAAFRDVPRAILSCIPDPLTKGNYILCLDKWSYGPGHVPICYSLDRSQGPVPRFTVLGDCIIDADHLDGDRVTGAERAEWEAAHELLRAMIGETFCEAAKVYTAGAACGIGKGKIWRAKVELGVRHERDGFGPGSHVKWIPPQKGWPESLVTPQESTEEGGGVCAGKYVENGAV